MKNIMFYLILSFLLLGIQACHKGFLEPKPNKSLFVPSTLDELSAILDNVSYMNKSYPSLGYVASDEFFVTDDLFNSLYEFDQATYLWDTGRLKESLMLLAWETPYTVIFRTNIVKEALEANSFEGNQAEFNRIKGSALFYRAFAYHHLSRYFCLPFVGADPENTGGLLIKTQADVNEETSVKTLKETYDFILDDLIEAAKLLPETAPYRTRPTRIAARALLARIYLEMEDYEKAYEFADEVLNSQENLLDYRELDISLGNPFPVSMIADNIEVLFYAEGLLSNYINSSSTGIDTILYESYELDDLRKVALYTEQIGDLKIKTLTGHYTGNQTPFYGLATNEILLIRAECAVRLGDQQQALTDLNYLLTNRYNENFNKLGIQNSEGLLERIVLERRKELVGRGLRWYDMRRLHNDDRFNVEPVRNINGAVRTLTISEQPFVFPMPINETSVQ